MTDTTAESSTVPLSLVKPGERVRVSAIQAGHRFRTRLHAMGLTLGSTLEVLNSVRGHPVVLQVMGSRVAIGYRMAQKILVRKIQ